jgi:hypothetical protein
VGVGHAGAERHMPDAVLSKPARLAENPALLYIKETFSVFDTFVTGGD